MASLFANVDDTDASGRLSGISRLQVKVEYSHASGALTRSKSGKDAELELQWSGSVRKLQLLVNLCPNTLCVPLQPPLMMTTARIAEGSMSLRVSNVKLSATANPVTVQVMLSEADPTRLMKLRDAVNVCMSRILRKPLQQLSSNTLQQRESSLPSVKRKAVSIAGPTSSTFSNCSNQAGTGGVTSRFRPTQEEEELMPLSDEQREIVNLVTAGKSVFFTGCAGTGKSLVLKHILKALPRETTYMTASTGLAACALGGTTVHAFSGVGRAEDVAAAIKAAMTPEARQRWCRATTLIVDEVSMVDGKFFDMLSVIARHVRGSDKPFGGLQLVLAGDFHQLPPVAKGPTAASQRKFCFEAAAWKLCVPHCLQLTEVFRQADNDFVDLLAAVRSGSCSEELLNQLQERCGAAVDVAEGILCTKLFTHRADVDLLNQEQLRQLPGLFQRFVAQDSGSSPEALHTGCPAREVLELKVGAQVMLIRNMSQSRGLVNGARGVVERWVGSTTRLPVVRFANGEVTTVRKERWTIASGSKVVACRVQVPLELAWAMSVHKCQGMTLDCVEVNLDKAFEPGMAYVALSRVRSLKGLRINGSIHPRALAAHPKVLAFYQQLATTAWAA